MLADFAFLSSTVPWSPIAILLEVPVVPVFELPPLAPPFTGDVDVPVVPVEVPLDVPLLPVFVPPLTGVDELVEVVPVVPLLLLEEPVPFTSPFVGVLLLGLTGAV